MVIYPNEYDGTHLKRCAICDAVVAGWGHGNAVCAACGMTLVEPPFEGCNYFEMVMKLDALRRTARRQRTG